MPTARAVTEAVVSVKRDYEASQPVTADEKKAYDRAYEAARPAGGGQPAYDAAGREAVAARRREHGMPAAGPLSVPVPPRTPAPDHAAPLPVQQDARVAEARARTDDIKAELDKGRMEILCGLLRGEDPEPLAAGLETWGRGFRAGRDDPEEITALIWDVLIGPEIEAIRAWPHGAYADAVLAEDDELARLFREKFRPGERSAGPGGHGETGPGTDPPEETEAADSAHGQPGLDADGYLMPDYEAGDGNPGDDPWDDAEFGDLFRGR
jgi:hypothetical protein